MSRYYLTDFEWRVIEPLLPKKPRGVRVFESTTWDAGCEVTLNPTLKAQAESYGLRVNGCERMDLKPAENQQLTR